MGNDKNLLGNLVYWGVIVSSIVSVFVVLCDSRQPNYYDTLFLIPLFFGISSFAFYSIYQNVPRNIGITFIILLCYYRCVILPIFMVFGNYESLLKIQIQNNTNSAVWLMIYEIIVIFFSIRMALRKRLYIGKIKYSNVLFNQIFLLLVGFDVLIWIIVPEVREDYRTLFNMFDDDFTLVLYSNKLNEVGSIKRILITLFSVTFGITRILFPAYCMVKISQRFQTKPWSGILLSLFFILFQLFFVTSTIAFSLICCLVLFIFLSHLYPIKAKYLMFVGGGGAVLFVGFYFVSRFLGGLSSVGNTSLMGYLSASQIAYFTGIDNISAIFNLPDKMKWWVFLTDITHCIPFNSTLFDLQDQLGSQEFFNSNNLSMGQIPPTIGLGYYYWGILLAPCFSSFLAYLATRMGMRANMDKRVLVYLSCVCCALFAAMGIVMYNFFISLSWIFSMVLPMYFLSTLYKRCK